MSKFHAALIATGLALLVVGAMGSSARTAKKGKRRRLVMVSRVEFQNLGVGKPLGQPSSLSTAPPGSTPYAFAD